MALATTQLDVAAPAQVPVGTYLRSRGRRLVWIIVLIPLVAAVATAGVLMNKPARYESTLRVIIPEELGASSVAVGLYLANLEQRLIDPQVVERVTTASTVAPDDYVAGIRLERIGQSRDAEFRFVDDDPRVAQTVVQTAASSALRLLAEEGLPFAKREVKLAESSYREAARELDAFRLRHDVAYPDEQYQQVTSELQAAEAELESAQARDDAETAADASAAIDRLEKQRTKLEQTLSEYQRLDDARMVTLELRSRARDRLVSQQTEIRLTSQANIRRDITTHQISQRRLVLQGAAAAAGAALFLEFAAIVLPDLVRSGKRNVAFPASSRV